MLVCKYVDENSSAAMLVAKRSADVTPEVNLKEHTSHMPLPSVNKAAHYDICDPTKRTDVLQFFFIKKRKFELLTTSERM